MPVLSLMESAGGSLLAFPEELETKVVLSILVLPALLKLVDVVLVLEPCL